MTRKDFQLIADVISETEADWSEVGADVLRSLVERFCDRLKADNPRFDRGKFENAALPIASEQLRARIMANLAREETR